jgi:hypothetical protein
MANARLTPLVHPPPRTVVLGGGFVLGLDAESKLAPGADTPVWLVIMPDDDPIGGFSVTGKGWGGEGDKMIFGGGYMVCLRVCLGVWCVFVTSLLRETFDRLL